MSEKEFVIKLKTIFEKQFIVKSEVKDKTQTHRIDLILKMQPDVYFGIECKIPDRMRGEKIGEYIKQAIRYSYQEFEVEPKIFKKIPIFICPPLTHNYFIFNAKTIKFDGIEWHRDMHDKSNTHNTVNGFLGAFGIGEVRKFYNNSYKFIVSNQIIYCSIYGFRENNYLKLLKKLEI
jgi:hypothetical protein